MMNFVAWQVAVGCVWPKCIMLLAFLANAKHFLSLLRHFQRIEEWQRVCASEIEPLALVEYVRSTLAEASLCPWRVFPESPPGKMNQSSHTVGVLAP